MKAMVFAAGMGSRLGSITESVPKALVEVAGKPMLQHVLEKLKAAGVSEVTINLFHLGDVIQEFLTGAGNFGLKINYSKEGELLGTGGGLKQASQYFSGTEPFIIHNCDIFSDLDLLSMIQAHKAGNAIATLAVMKREATRGLFFDSNGELIGWNDEIVAGHDPEKAERLAFSGIHVAQPQIFKYMQSESGNFSIFRPYLQAVRHKEKVAAYRIDDCFWADMGKPQALEQLREKLGG